MKKYWQLIKYALASLSSFLLDSGLFYLFKRFVFGGLGAWTDLACTVAARALSSFYNFNVNNRLVFGHRGEYGKALGRYYLLAVPLMLCAVLEAQRFFEKRERMQQKNRIAEASALLLFFIGVPVWSI